MNVVKSIKELFGDLAGKIALAVCSVASELCKASKDIANYLKIVHEDNKIKKQQKEEQQRQEDLEDIADKGTINDVLKIVESALLAICFFAAGCTTDLNITATNDWEGHYYTVKDAKNALNDATLGKKQSIWIISNDTMSKILKKINK